MQFVRQLLLVIIGVYSCIVFAQAEEGSSGGASEANFEGGLHVGNFLPNQISGVTEIIGLGGVRAGMRLASGTFMEGGLITGNGEGARWKNLHLDIRIDIPVENLLAVAYVGADSIMYSGNGVKERLIFGAHAGGGLKAHLSGIAWFRADMKFGVSPGTSLYIGVGLVFHLGASASAGGGA